MCHPLYLEPERAARNRSLSRAVNYQIEELSRRVFGFDPVEYVCECADLTCPQRIAVPPEEYQRVRRHPAAFFVAPGHEQPDLEEVVSEHPRWVIVRELNAGAQAARELALGRTHEVKACQSSRRRSQRAAPTSAAVGDRGTAAAAAVRAALHPLRLRGRCPDRSRSLSRLWGISLGASDTSTLADPGRRLTRVPRTPCREGHRERPSAALALATAAAGGLLTHRRSRAEPPHRHRSPPRP